MTINFDGHHGRLGIIQIKESECLSCHAQALCLMIDASEGEYTPGTICKPCIDELFLSRGYSVVDQQRCDALLNELDDIATDASSYEYGLPITDVEFMARMRKAIYKWVGNEKSNP